MHQKLLATIAVFAFTTGIALGDDYTPDVLELNGKETLIFAPESEFSIMHGGTLEFWVAPDWTSDPGYDPVVISSAGQDGVNYMIAVLRHRDGLGVLIGEYEHAIAFDFSDNQLHHIALVVSDNELIALIDGRLRAALAIQTMPNEPEGFWVGTADGETAPFIGAIAGLRIWSTALSQAELVEYALKPVVTEAGQHPALDHLVVISDFDQDSVYVVEPPTLNEQEQQP